jgi:tetratricopeptide (TPR) repeat protein
MKGHILFEKIDTYREEVDKRPLALLPNILLMTYLAIAKKYDELLSQTERFSMENMQTNILVEDFSLLGNIALGKSAADILLKNILMLDPEDPYAHLLKAVLMPSTDNVLLASIMLGGNDKRLIKDSLPEPKNGDTYRYYRIPDIIGVNDGIAEGLQKMIEKDPANVILRTSLAEVHMKLDHIEKAQKEISFILSLHPHYIRALHLMQRILNDYYGKENESLNLAKKIYKLNPVSHYLKGVEVMFIEESDVFMNAELKDLFERENPFLTFFKENFRFTLPKKEENSASKTNETEIIEVKSKTLKDAKEVKTQEVERESGKEVFNNPVHENPIDAGYENLYKKNYKSAIESFLKDLKQEKQ